MSKEVSNKVVVILLVLAFIFSIGGTFLVYESVNNYKENMVQFGMSSGTTGFVSLEVTGDYRDVEGNEIENIK